MLDALGLRDAHERWRELDMPYDAARARVRIGLACRRLGDEDAAGLELDAARQVCEQLEARPALAELAKLEHPSPRPGGLTERECEVLRHIASGQTGADRIDVVTDRPPVNSAQCGYYKSI